jgi:hypothetical protein
MERIDSKMESILEILLNLPSVHLDHKDLTFEEYTERFQEQNQQFQDASDAIKHYRAKMNNLDLKIGMKIVNKLFNIYNIPQTYSAITEVRYLYKLNADIP